MRTGYYDEDVLRSALGEPVQSGLRIGSGGGWKVIDEGTDVADVLSQVLGPERYMIWDCLGGWNQLTSFEQFISSVRLDACGTAAEAVEAALVQTRDDYAKILDRFVCIAIEEDAADHAIGRFNLVNVCALHATDGARPR